MKNILIIIFITISLSSNSQVILDLKDYPQLGTEIIFANVKDTANLNNFKFSKTGINNFWDFSELKLNYNDTIKLIDPNQTPYNLNFFDADRTFQYGSEYGDFLYFKADSIGYYQLGYTSYLQPCPFYQPLRYNKPFLLLSFPASYPFLKLDTVHVRTKNYLNNTMDTAYCEEYIFSTKEIIATGTIKLPFGVFESFLLKTTLAVFDTTWIKGTDGKWSSEINVMPGGADTYNWFCNKSTYTVAQINSSGFNNVDNLFVQMNNYANLKSVSVNDVEPSQINIYPNPASSKLFIENMNFKNSSYVITDISGREIKRDNLQTEINIEDLQHGMYIISLYSNKELKGRVKFVKK